MARRPWYSRQSLFAALQTFRDWVYSLIARNPRAASTLPPLNSKLDLNALDWRSPPSESICNSAIPLAMTAAAMAAEVYYLSTLETAETNTIRSDENEQAQAEAKDEAAPMFILPKPDSDEGAPSPAPNVVPDGGAASNPDAKVTPNETIAEYMGGALNELDLPPAGALTSLDGLNYGPLQPNGGGGGGSGGLHLPLPTSEFGPTTFDPSLNDSSPEIPSGNSATGSSTFTAAASNSNSVTVTSPPAVSRGSSITKSASDEPLGKPSLIGNLEDQPVQFVANAGQWASNIDFGVQGAGYQAWISQTSAVFDLSAGATNTASSGTRSSPAIDTVQLSWTGMNSNVEGVGQGEQTSVSNFLVGNDPSQWRTNVPQYSSVQYSNAWNGIDLVYYQSPSGGVEYNLVFQPDADLSAVGFQVTGATAQVENGQLVLTTPGGNKLTESAPSIYQTASDGTLQKVSGGFVVNADGSIGFRVGAYDASRPLTIDPSLLYTATLGSNSFDALSIATDASGDVYVVGPTTNTNYPAFVEKFAPNGSLDWYTTLGGTVSTIQMQQASGVAVSSNGTVYVVGSTTATNFPVTSGAFQTSNAGGYDAFLSELSAATGSLISSTYLGGTQDDHAQGVAVYNDNGANTVAITGYTDSSNYPTASAYQSTLDGTTDNAFLTEFTSSGMVFSTYLGGSSNDQANGVAFDPFGDAVIVGTASSINFPTLNAYQSSLAGTSNAFVSEFNPSGGLVASTYLGGSGTDTGTAVAVDDSGDIYTTGSTTSSNFPVFNAAQGSLTGSQDAFLTQFSNLSIKPSYSTYQGSNVETGYGVAVDSNDEATVVGFDSMGTYLTVNRYTVTGSSMDFVATYANATGYAAAVDDFGEIYAAGYSSSGGALVLKYGPPAAPAINAFANNGLTNNSTPTVSGTATAYATITLYQSNTFDTLPSVVGTVTASSGGLWTYNYTGTLQNGQYAFSATEVTGGGVSLLSQPVTLTIDTTPPTVSVSVVPDTYSPEPEILVQTSDVYGFSNSAVVTLAVDLNNDDSFTDSGDANYATATLDNGVADFTSYPPLPLGSTVEVEAEVTDSAGNTGTSSPAQVVVGAPSSSVTAPVISSFTTDTSGSAHVTSDNTPVLSGSSPNSATINIYATYDTDTGVYMVNQYMGTAVANGSGAWSYTSGTLTNGIYVFTATATVSQQTSVTSAPFAITIDTAAPTVAVPVSPTYYGDETLSAAVSDLHGLAAGATVTLEADVDGGGFSAYATTTLSLMGSSAGTATFSGYGAFLAGTTVSFEVQVDDLAGSLGTSPITTVVVSPLSSSPGTNFVPPFSPPPTVPPAPVIVTMTNDTSGGDWITSDTTPTLYGTATAYATVTLYHADPGSSTFVEDGSTTANSSGLWTFAYDNPLANGVNEFEATQTVSGTTSDFSAQAFALIDNTAPSISISLAGSPDPFTTKPTFIAILTGTVSGYPTGAQVTFSYDTTDTDNYSVLGTTGLLTGSSGSDGGAVFTSPAALPDFTLVGIRSQVTNSSGTGTVSVPVTITPIASVPPPPALAATNMTALIRSTYGGMSGWTSSQDQLMYAGNVSTGINLVVDQSPTPPEGQTVLMNYNSQDANPVPVIQIAIPSSYTTTLPSSVTGSLTWDGVTGSTITYTLSALTTGSNWVFAAAAPSNQATGEYTYTLDLTIHYTTSAWNTTISDSSYTFVSSLASSPYGSGWAFSGTNTLVPITAPTGGVGGLLMQYGTGGWSFYANNGSGGYVSPAGDAGTLVTMVGGGWKYTSSNGIVDQFNSSGQMTNWTSADGFSVVTFSYSGSTLSTVKSPDGGIATFAYSGGLLQTITAPGSRVTSFSYTGSDLTTFTLPTGGTNTFTYSNHDLTGETAGSTVESYTYLVGLAASTKAGTSASSTVTAGLAAGLNSAAIAPIPNAVPGSYTDPLGNVTRYYFNNLGQTTESIAPNGAVQTYVRNGNGFVTQYTDPMGLVTTYAVNASGQITQETLPNNITATWVYLGANNSLTSYTDFNSNTWVYTNDSYGRLLTAKDPNGNTTTYSYSSTTGLLQSMTDPNGIVTDYYYDADRRLTGETVGGVSTGSYTYNAAGYVATFTDPDSNTTTYLYDADGNVTETIDPNGNVTTAVYDAAGNLVSTTDPDGNVTSYAYNALGQTTLMIQAYGTSLAATTTYLYDADGNQTGVINPDNETTKYVYDSEGRLIETIDPNQNATYYSYNLDNQLVLTINAMDGVTSYLYNKSGELIGTDDPMHYTTTFVLDNDGNTLTVENPQGDNLNYVYNKAGQLTASSDGDGNWTTYAYYPNGWLESVTTPNEDPTYLYNAQGSVTETIVPDTPSNEITYSYYDNADRLTGTVDPDGNTAKYYYDPDGNLTGTLDPDSHWTKTLYDADSNPTVTIDGNNNRTTSLYDALGQVTQVTDPMGNVTKMLYDKAGNVTETIDARGSITKYFYDADGNLTGTIDPLLNLTQYSYNPLNEQSSMTNPLGRVFVYGYDADGRQMLIVVPNCGAPNCGRIGSQIQAV